MGKNWKQWILKKAEPLLLRQKTPLLVKDLAFRAIWVAIKSGRSNPISFALRPVFMHKKLKTVVGIQLAMAVVVIAVVQPLPTMAEDAGGQISLSVVDTGEVHLSTQPGVSFPLTHWGVSQGFKFFHPGVDLRAPIGEPIRPIMNGVVVKAEKAWFGYGNMVVVKHGAEHESLYAHMSKITSTVGQEVTTETVIGLVGSTGRSTGPHLHLEIYENGKQINPMPILGVE